MRGNLSVYGKFREENPVPAERVETWIEEIDDPSGWATEIVTWKRIWASPDAKPEIIAELNKKFPRPEHKPRKAIPKKKKRPPSDYQ